MIIGYKFPKKSSTVNTALYISLISEKLNHVMHLFSNVYVKRISIFTLCKLNFENAYDLQQTINNSKKHVWIIQLTLNKNKKSFQGDPKVNFATNLKNKFGTSPNKKGLVDESLILQS